jgi:hypothetical protein
MVLGHGRAGIYVGKTFCLVMLLNSRINSSARSSGRILTAVPDHNGRSEAACKLLAILDLTDSLEKKPRSLKPLISLRYELYYLPSMLEPPDLTDVDGTARIVRFSS